MRGWWGAFVGIRWKLHTPTSLRLPSPSHTRTQAMSPPTPLPDTTSLPPTPDAGLTAAEAAARLARFGRNELADNKQNKWAVLGKLVSGGTAKRGEWRCSRTEGREEAGRGVACLGQAQCALSAHGSGPLYHHPVPTPACRRPPHAVV